MKLQIGNFPRRLSMEERLTIGGALGFDSTSLPVLFGRLDPYLETHSVDDLKSLLEDNGLSLANVWAGPLYEHDGERWDQKLEEAKPYLELVAELGGRQIGINTPMCWPKVAGEYEWEWLANKYRQYLDILDQYGLELVLEYLGPHLAAPIRGSREVYPFVDNLNTAVELVKRIDRPNVGLILDVMHWWAGGGTFEDLHKVKGMPLALHFFDVKKGVTQETVKDRDRVLPGEGIIDLVKFLRILKEDGFDGDVMPEILGEAGQVFAEADGWEGPRRIRDVYRGIMEEV